MWVLERDVDQTPDQGDTLSEECVPLDAQHAFEGQAYETREGSPEGLSHLHQRVVTR